MTNNKKLEILLVEDRPEFISDAKNTMQQKIDS